MSDRKYVLHRVKIRNFYTGLGLLFTVHTTVIAKYFKVSRTCRGTVAMATIYLIIMDIIVKQYSQFGKYMCMCRHEKLCQYALSP